MKSFLTFVSSLLLSLFLVLSPINSHALDFSLAGDGVVEMTGDFNDDDFPKFLEFVKTEIGHAPTVIHIHDSTGGSWGTAIAIGVYARTLGITTMASGFCYSSCAFVWLAGAVRAMTEDAQVLLHMPYSAAAGATSINAMTSTAWYMGYMQLPGQAVVDIMNFNVENGKWLQVNEGLMTRWNYPYIIVELEESE